MNIHEFEKNIIPGCKKCPRLAVYTREVAEKKVRRFSDQDYWGKPVPGFGDYNAKVLIIGLAPAAHGANRTGRMFTGDDSGNWLYHALYENGFANQPESIDKNDGLKLKDVYITATIRCAPPQNKPLPSEISNCRPYLEEELTYIEDLKVILCLGNIAFTHYCRIKGIKGLKFAHNRHFELNNGIRLISSYHPSRQNTQTGRLKWNDWNLVFSDIKKFLEME